MPNLTIKDIARLSGCSVSTISRVINDRPDVRPETKEKVLQVMLLKKLLQISQCRLQL